MTEFRFSHHRDNLRVEPPGWPGGKLAWSFRDHFNFYGVDMNRITIAALLSTVVTAHAVAAGENWGDNEGTVHFGIKLGPTNVKNYPSGMGMYGGYTIYGPDTFPGNAFLAKLSIAVEGEWVDLGHSSGSTEKAETLGIAMAATYPITPEFSAIAKAGASGVTHESDCVQPPCSTFTVGVHGAAAVQFRLTPLMSFRAGYDFYPAGYNMTSASIVYRY